MDAPLPEQTAESWPMWFLLVGLFGIIIGLILLVVTLYAFLTDAPGKDATCALIGVLLLPVGYGTMRFGAWWANRRARRCPSCGDGVDYLDRDRTWVCRKCGRHYTWDPPGQRKRAKP